MSAIEVLKQGDVKSALKLLQDEIRQRPDDSKLRVFLFQLLAVMGNWERALTQLNVVRDLDDGALAMVQTCQETLNCEALRARIFRGEKTPVVFGQPEPWIALMIEALRADAAGQHAEATAVRQQALEEAPTCSGSLVTQAHLDAHEGDDPPAGDSFEWICDADSRLGPLLEVIVNGRYTWVPFHRIANIKVEAPTDLRDMVWTAAYFQWENGGETVGMIPTRYVNSEQADDGAIQLARKTEWQEVAANSFHGLGQRLLATDQNDYGILDIREIRISEVQA